MPSPFRRYDWQRTYEWNYAHPPAPVEVEVPPVPGSWRYCGLPIDSPLGVPAGPLLNGKWCLYYASLGFDLLTYKTVRSQARSCYPLPNLQPVQCGDLQGGESRLPACREMHGSWAVSYGMPSRAPDEWRADVEQTRDKLPSRKRLSVSVVATVQPDWGLEELADDYARCARWALDSGADAIETNFSCPNVSTCDGQLYQNPEDSARVAQRVRQEIGSAPFAVKIGHAPADGGLYALLDALQGTVDALATTNSIASTVQAEDGQLLFDGQPRGICGSAIRAESVRQVQRMSDRIRERGYALELVGVGGVSCFADVQQYLSAGAAAVHIASAAIVEPGVALQIRRDWASDATAATRAESSADRQ